MTLLVTMLAIPAMARDTDQLRCPASVAAAAEAAEQGVEESLSLLDLGTEPSLRCEDGSEAAFLAVRESWDECPTTRLTRVFLVCASQGTSQATWTRFWYWRRWPTVLGDPVAATACRRTGRRFTTPQDLHVDGGTFTPSAVADLAAYLDVLKFWEMPYETVSEDRQAGHFGVGLVRATVGDSTRTVVGGEFFCNPLPQGLDALVGHLLSKPDPVEFLVSKHEALHDRLEDQGESPPGP